MVFCIVPTCKERTGKARKGDKDVKVTFHVFPADVSRKKQWANSIGVKVETLNKYTRICSKHFTEEMFDRTSLSSVRLRANAVPHLKSTQNQIQLNSCFVIKTEIEEPKSLIECYPYNQLDPSKCEYNLNQEKASFKLNLGNRSEKFDLEIKETTLQSMTDVCSPIERISQQRNVCNTDDLCSTSKSGRSKLACDMGRSISTFKNANSPAKRCLQDELRKERLKFAHKIKILKQNQRRKKRRIAALTSILKSLREKRLQSEKQLSALKILDT